MFKTALACDCVKNPESREFSATKCFVCFVLRSHNCHCILSLWSVASTHCKVRASGPSAREQWCRSVVKLGKGSGSVRSSHQTVSDAWKN